MQWKNDHFTIGWVNQIYETEINKGYSKREFVIRNIHKKRNKWYVVDIPFVATGDAIEQLDLVYPGLEVMVQFSIKSRTWVKDNVVQQKNGKDVRFLELSAWKIFSHTDRIKDKEDPIWEINNYDDVKSNKDAANKEPLKVTAKKNRNPDTKKYDAKTYSAQVDYGEPVTMTNEDGDAPLPPDDDLPF